MMTANSTKLRVEGLKKHFPVNTGLLASLLEGSDQKMVKAVDGVDLDIREGESVGIAGESGCGKTTFGKTAIRLYEPSGGSIYFEGDDITTIDGKELTEFRRNAQIIHQDPFNSINPRFSVFKWVKEPLDIHGIGTPEDREARVFETMELAGLRPVESFTEAFPSELSGGERQRVSIARALVMNPSFLLADEPASMLDVSIRASILDTFDRLQDELGLTILYISHDLSLLKHVCDRIVIMYLGEVIEEGPAQQIVQNPKHPYTKALVSSVPIIDPDQNRERHELKGEVPDSVNVPSGCRFHPRCTEIVPPTDYSFDQGTWLGVWKLRQALQSGDIETRLPPTELRSEYDIPLELSDSDAEAVLADALTQMENDDIEKAATLLGEEFVSPCETPTIPTSRVGEDQTAKCLLYDE